MFTEQEWYGIMCRTLTAIRGTWSVEKLAVMAEEGHETPACGDTMRKP